MSDDQRIIQQAVTQAEQIVNASEANRYPLALRQAALAVLLDPSEATCRTFVEKYELLEATKHVAVGRSLPYPPSRSEFHGPGAARDGIRIGRQVLRGWSVSIPLTDRRPVVIAGSVGSGKTVAMTRIAQELARLQGEVRHGPAAICLDPQHNFGGLARFGYNVLDSVDLRLAWLQDHAPGFVPSIISLTGHLRGLKKSTHLIGEARRMIDPVLPDELAPPLSHIIEVLHRPGKLKLPGKTDYAWSAVTELTSKARSTPIWRPAYSDMPLRMVDSGQLTVVRTGTLDVTERRELIGWLVECWNKTGLARSRPNNLYLLGDEGLILYRRDYSAGNAMESLRNELLSSRQQGIVPVVNLQLPSEAVPELLGSAGTIICCGMSGEKDCKAVAHAMGLEYDRDVRRLLQSLPIDQALLYTKGRPGPFRVKIPYSGLPDCGATKRRDSAQAFLGRCDVRSGLPWKKVYRRIKPSASPASSASGTPTTASASSAPDDHVVLTKLGRSHNDPPHLRNLAQGVGMSRVALTRRLEELENRGLVRRDRLQLGRRRMTLAELTPRGFRTIGRTPPSGGGRGGPGHRYLVSRLEEHFAGKGHETRREADVRGKSVDLLVKHGPDRTLVEVERTDATCRSNATADLQAADPGDRLLFVTPTKKLLRKIKRHVKDVVDQKLGRIDFVAFRDL